MEYYKFLEPENNHLIWRTIKTQFLESEDALYLWNYLFVSSSPIDALTDFPGSILCLVEKPRMNDKYFNVELKIVGAWHWTKNDFTELTENIVEQYMSFWEREKEYVNVNRLCKLTEIVKRANIQYTDFCSAFGVKELLEYVYESIGEERGWWSNAKTMKENINNWMLNHLSSLEEVNLKDLSINFRDKHDTEED